MAFPNIILFGDSLTEQSFSPARHGFAASLSNSYVRRADVLNRGLSGYNTAWLLPFLDQVLAAQLAPVLLWIIWVGANDAVLPAYPHHVPLDKYKQNLKEMVSRIRAHGEGKILFITPPPIDVEMLKVHHRRKGNDRDAEVTKGYARACVEAAGELGVGVVDFWEVVKSRAGTNPRGWFTDGLHLGPKGYRALEETVMEFIGREWPELRPQNLPMMAPWVGDLEVVREWERKQMHEEL